MYAEYIIISSSLQDEKYVQDMSLNGPNYEMNSWG